jgi:SREBP regulating gene protein
VQRELVATTASAEQSTLSLDSVEDRFEVCSALCRTSSNSVVDSRRYRSEQAKFCYLP